MCTHVSRVVSHFRHAAPRGTLEVVTDSQAEKLAAAIAERGLSIRGAAKLLADVSGNTLESERRSIYRWLNGEGISDERAPDLERVFGYPMDYFKRPRGALTNLAALNQQLAEVALAVEELGRNTNRILDVLEQLVDDPPVQALATSKQRRRP